MSHTLRLTHVKVTDLAALADAVARVPGAFLLGHGRWQLYDMSHTGTAVRLPGWNFPVIVTPDGDIVFDNYRGWWGETDQLDALVQAYCVEKARKEAVAMGYTVEETTVETTGDVVLRIQVGG